MIVKLGLDSPEWNRLRPIWQAGFDGGQHKARSEVKR